MDINFMKILLKSLTHPGETLIQRILRSGLWLGIFKITERILRFIKTIILARLLAPADFGLFGIACLAINTLQTFSETGIKAALIQKNTAIEGHLNSAWTISVVRGGGLCALLLILAPHIAQFFQTPEAESLIRLISLGVLIVGFANIGVVYFEKEIDFRKQSVLNFSRIAGEFILGIILAYTLRNSWALIWALLLGRFAFCVSSYLLHPFRPRLHFEKEKIFGLMHFGKWIFASSILGFLLTQGDNIVVGKLLGTTALGLYTMAYAISNLVTTELTFLVSNVVYPAYAKLQSDIKRLREGYLTVLQIIAFISFPLTGGIILFGRDFIMLFMGEKWLDMLIPMQILAIFGAIRSIGATTGPVYQGMGRPAVVTNLQLGQLILALILIFPLSMKMHITGTSLAVLLAAIPVNTFNLFYLAKFLKVDIRELIKPLLIPVGLTALSYLLIRNICLAICQIWGVMGFFAGSVLFLLSYLVFAWIFGKPFNYDIYTLLKKYMKKI
jgi:O-antigen/teichoic acid export membrane protein